MERRDGEPERLKAVVEGYKDTGAAVDGLTAESERANSLTNIVD